MVVRDDPFTGDHMTLKVYRWAEKEVASGTPNGSLKTFEVDNTIVNALGVSSTPLPDYLDANSQAALRDYAVYFRKNNVDTRVDEVEFSSYGATPATVAFVSAPSTAVADSIVVSYPYTSTDDGVTDFTYYITDYSPTMGSRDISETKVCGGRSYKIRASQGLHELSVTALIKDALLSSAVNGDIIKTTTEVAGYTIKSTIGGTTSTPRCIVLKHTDPDNTNEFVAFYMRNVSGESQSESGSATDAYTETVVLKCNPFDGGRITKEAT